MMSKARSANRTVLAMAALAVLASLALFGGAEAAILEDLIPEIIGPLAEAVFGDSAPTGALTEVANWLLGMF